MLGGLGRYRGFLFHDRAFLALCRYRGAQRAHTSACGSMRDKRAVQAAVLKISERAHTLLGSHARPSTRGHDEEEACRDRKSLS